MICSEPIKSGEQIDAVVPGGLGRRRPVAERTMRPDCVVVVSPLLDQHLSVLQCVENLAVEQLVPELAIEALVEAVFPR